ncbi:hypothetical protein INR49_007173, partial [Caranx melampygus]
VCLLQPLQLQVRPLTPEPLSLWKNLRRIKGIRDPDPGLSAVEPGGTGRTRRGLTLLGLEEHGGSRGSVLHLHPAVSSAGLLLALEVKLQLVPHGLGLVRSPVPLHGHRRRTVRSVHPAEHSTPETK